MPVGASAICVYSYDSQQAKDVRDGIIDREWRSDWCPAFPGHLY